MATGSERRRMGRFEVSRELVVGAYWRNMQVLMCRMVVLEATYHADTDTFSYLALSDLFEPVEPYEPAPWYSFMFRRDESGIHLDSTTRLSESPHPVAPPTARIRRLIEQA